MTKPMKNSQAQKAYLEEVGKLVHDLNMRYVRARLPELSLTEAGSALNRIVAGETVSGVRPEDLLHLPHAEFYRRRGVPAFRMVGVDGETFSDLLSYLRHLEQSLPEAYRASRDYSDYVDTLGKIQRGEITLEAAVSLSPTLRRVGGSCPCSKSVRWVVDEAATRSAAGEAAVPAP